MNFKNFNKNWLNIPLVIRCAVEFIQLYHEHEKQEREWKREKKKREAEKNDPARNK